MSGKLDILKVAALVGFLSIVTPAIGQGTDPSTLPQPQFDFANRPVAVMISATLTDIGSTQLDAIEVSNVPAQTYVADPPLLEISYFTADDELLGRNNAWDPRWTFQHTDTGEVQQIDSPARGVFFVPLSRQLARVIIKDLVTSEPLLDVDVSNTVQSYCDTNPLRVSCLSRVFFDSFEDL